MRYPGGVLRIDKEASERLVRRAVEGGVNYFDTAYIYPGSEEATGEILERLGVRDQVYIATKLPHAEVASRADFDKFFNEQKRRLRTDRIDYYLMHNFGELAQWQRLRALGIEEWLAARQADGGIGQVGFSFHGTYGEFEKLVDAYDWDFIQIQYNYVNTNYQAGERGLRYAAAKGLPVVVMEPLLGGKLAVLPERAEAARAELFPDTSSAALALRWLWNQPEVTVVLSGMNTAAQLEQNLALAAEALPGTFTAAEQDAVRAVVKEFSKSDKIPCTGCNYCLPCPKKINIPGCFAAYNASYAIGRAGGIKQYVLSTGAMGGSPHLASSCIQCGVCENRCPQHIEIRNNLKCVKRRLQIPGLKVIAFLRKKLRIQ
ncbi:MAG: aldo/keto reductase [Firmicutes bacterium]|nr:aldo/keto reductase [Bacillota bacterium]